jgi:2-polyprenyl-3-methyl-5-hydroxy-6-metoxy-1,4-benzoquinol methylase
MRMSDYDRWHEALEVDEDAAAPWHQLVQRLLDPARDLQGRRVLEIGCGRGGFSVWLARHGAREVVAADVSAVALRKAAEHAAAWKVRNVTFLEADIQAIPEASSTFDAVFCCETVEHVPDPPRALRELARVLRRGGRLFLTTPNYLNAMGLYRGYLRTRGRRFTEAGQPINQFTTVPRTWLWLRWAGLKVERFDGAGHYLPYPGRPPLKLDALEQVPASRFAALHTVFVARKPE